MIEGMGEFMEMGFYKDIKGYEYDKGGCGGGDGQKMDHYGLK